jgi:osmotically-inducible protein OsmY
MRLRWDQRLIAAFLLSGAVSVGCATARVEEPAGGLVANSVLSGNVEAALGADPATSGRRISVASYSGIVELSGSVASRDERAAATSVALSVAGVELVLNVLQLEDR